MRKLMTLAVCAATYCFPTYAATEAECEVMWNGSIGRGEGVLSDAEAMRYAAAMRVRKYKLPVDGKISDEVFLDACEADVFSLRKADKGAPLRGANNFTESQAIDLAVAHGFINVSSFRKSNDGVWRGRGARSGQYFQVAAISRVMSPLVPRLNIASGRHHSHCL